MKDNYLYRAMNSNDEQNYSNFGYISCNLFRHKGLKLIKKEVFNGNIGLIFDRTIGHISGVNIKKSGWISTTSDLLFAISEYAIPQSGRYNIDSERKNIIVIDVDSSDEIDLSKCSRNDQNLKELSGKYINLSDNQLFKYVNDNYIRPLSANNKSYFYDKKYDTKKYVPTGERIKRFSNYATGVKEHLFYDKIKKEKIKYVLNPLEQDLIYTISKEFKNKKQREIVDFIKTKSLNIDASVLSKDELNIYNYLYNIKENKFNNLIDLAVILFNKEQTIYNAQDLYEILKEIKRTITKKILKQLNIEIDNISLPDDEIYISTSDYIDKKIINEKIVLTKTNKNDVVYIQDKNNNIVKRMDYFKKIA